MIILSGASDNHYASLLNFINSFIQFNEKNTLIVYNLGIDADKWKYIISKYSNNQFILFKVFDYSKYPSWFNININAGQYAWKPTIIYNTFIEYANDILVWMDAGNLIKNNLHELEEFIMNNCVYSANSDGNILKWTYPDTIKYMNCSWTNKVNRNGACIGLNANVDFVKELITDFYNYSQIKECIAPEGSSRKNHRQDQAVFSILFYKYLQGTSYEMYHTEDWKNHLCYSIHNDVEQYHKKTNVRMQMRFF